MNELIAPEKIEDIKNANDIVDTVSEYLALTRAGRNFKANCPFHQEKTPSFIVSPEKQIFHCFGCNEGGNVFTFIQKMENIPFIEAVKLLAGKAGIEIESFKPDSKAGEKEKILAVNKDALYFFREEFKKSDEAVSYLEKRKISPEAAGEFMLGFSPGSGKLYRFLKSKGHTEDTMLKSFLVSKRGNEFIDIFYKRIIFPILNIYGDPIAFGGRVLDESLPKYINSRESVVYYKGKNLYNLNNAKKYRMDSVIIVEGYTDAMSVYVNGIKSTVATLGTALTPDQARLIKRYFTKAVVVYDMDEAGRNGAVRGGENLFTSGVEAFVVSFSGAKDPDEFIEKFGAAAFKEAVEKAEPYIDFRINYLAGKGDELNPYHAEKVIKEIAGMLKQTPNLVVRNRAVNKLAERFSVTADVVRDYMGEDKAEAEKRMSLVDDIKRLKDKGTELAEKTILQVALSSFGKEDEELLLKHVFNRRANHKIEYGDFKNGFYAEILSKLEKEYETGGKDALKKTELFYIENSEFNSVISEILAEAETRVKDNAEDLMQVVDDCYFKIKKEKARSEIGRLQEMIKYTETAGDGEKVKELLREKQEYQKIIIQRGEYFE